MKRLWFAVGVMAVLFTATLLNSRYLRNFSAGLTDRLVQAEVQAEAGNWEEAGRLTKEALDVWTQPRHVPLYRTPPLRYRPDPYRLSRGPGVHQLPGGR